MRLQFEGAAFNSDSCPQSLNTNRQSRISRKQQPSQTDFRNCFQIPSPSVESDILMAAAAAPLAVSERYGKFLYHSSEVTGVPEETQTRGSCVTEASFRLQILTIFFFQLKSSPLFFQPAFCLIV